MDIEKNLAAIKLTEDEIVNELDDLLVEQLELVDVYAKSAIQEEKLFKDGLINIAHARLCMIPNNISTTGVLREDVDDDELPTAASTVISKGQDPRVLSIDTTKDKELLGLFGKNIPSSLKKAQTSFQHVLENVIDRANILSKMDLIYHKNCELMDERKKLRHGVTPSNDDKENEGRSN